MNDNYTQRTTHTDERATDITEQLSEVARHPSPLIRQKVARHPATSLETLVYLSYDEDESVRASVAECHLHADLPWETVSRLARDKSALVRMCVVWQEAMTAELLLRLAKDPDEHVRASVATTTLSDEVLISLAEDESDDVRECLSRNDAAPLEAIRPIAENPKDENCEWAREHPAYLTHLEELAKQRRIELAAELGVDLPAHWLDEVARQIDHTIEDTTTAQG